MSNMTQRLQHLRQLMAQSKYNIHAYLIPSCDAHQSEYIADCDARRAFISGFTGSAGYAVVTLKEAALWTDGRYFLQASQQLDPKYWTLMKQGLPETPDKDEWLHQVLPPQSRVGFDPRLTTIKEARTLSNYLSAKGHTAVPITHENLVDLVWAKDQPKRPANRVFELGIEYSGQSSKEKLNQLRSFLFKPDFKPPKPFTPLVEGRLPALPAGFVLTALDEIAWLFNLRGSDILYNPVFLSFAIVLPDRCLLYVQEVALEQQAKHMCEATQIEVKSYDAFYTDMPALAKLLQLGSQQEGRVKRLLVGSAANDAIRQALGSEEFVEVIHSPVQDSKAIKNAIELEGFRQCHIRDAAALCKYFAWLEHELTVNKRKDLNEVQVADQLEGFRKQQRDFMGLSFDTISSVGPNAAIIHYKPEPETCANLDVDQIYLCDSGGQYLDGTTDVTRTLHFGKPTEFERAAYTRVLQGHIALDKSVFPQGTTGYALDVLARLPLWSMGLDFRHGTGHGVGAFLNVHEGPQGIGYRIAYNDFPIKPGMTLTNEPGYYHDHAFGIRIENVMLTKQVVTPHRFGDKDYLGFEPVTLVPMCQNLIDKTLLSRSDVEWLNQYHLLCRQKVGPLLANDPLAMKWFQRETEKIE